jgi:hypothetical protein
MMAFVVLDVVCITSGQWERGMQNVQFQRSRDVHPQTLARKGLLPPWFVTFYHAHIGRAPLLVDLLEKCSNAEQVLTYASGEA